MPPFVPPYAPGLWQTLTHVNALIIKRLRGRNKKSRILRLGLWYHQQESNLYLALRRHSFYPLNYGGELLIVFGEKSVKGAFSIVWHGEDQVNRGFFAGLGAHGEAP